MVKVGCNLKTADRQFYPKSAKRIDIQIKAWEILVCNIMPVTKCMLGRSLTTARGGGGAHGHTKIWILDLFRIPVPATQFRIQLARQS